MAGKPEGGAGPQTSRSIVMRVLGQPQMTEAALYGAPLCPTGHLPQEGRLIASAILPITPQTERADQTASPLFLCV
ncbi:hypothetical protein EFV37_04515 [Mesorhizobium loti]|nr:hypothetical protein A9K72_08350 [Mesorhizobium loti]QKC61647.1 hypothetical protein EB229_04515 [Mesorhizobium jarvisii]QKD07556.1 hypothetical protein EFV37_04515 [Mesorhizobium loti]